MVGKTIKRNVRLSGPAPVFTGTYGLNDTTNMADNPVVVVPRDEENQAAAVVPRDEENQAAVVVPRDEENQAAVVPRDEENQAAVVVPRDEENQAAVVVPRDEENQAAVVPRDEENHEAEHVDNIETRVLKKMDELKITLCELKNTHEKTSSQVFVSFGEILTDVRELAGDTKFAVNVLHRAMDVGNANYASRSQITSKKRRNTTSTTSHITLYDILPEFADVLKITEVTNMVEENKISPNGDGLVRAMHFNKIFWGIMKMYNLNSKNGISWENRNDIPSELIYFLNQKLTSTNANLTKTETMHFKEVSSFVSEFCKGPNKKTQIIKKNVSE